MELLKIRIRRSEVGKLLFRTLMKWQRDECLEMGAALSYYALFSIFPIFLVILSIFGFLLGPDTSIHLEILRFAQEALPQDAYQIVEATLTHLNRSSVGAGIIGFLLLFGSASSVFSALSRSVDRIWQSSRPQPRNVNWKTAAGNFLQDRITAFALVLGTAVLMFISLLMNIVAKVLQSIVSDVNSRVGLIQIDEVLLLKNLQLLGTYLFLMMVVMVLFKVLPAVRVRWSDVWLGALLTTIILMGLQQLASSSVIQVGSQFRSYGVIGGVMVLMLWIYLACQIFFFGSEFTYIYTHMYGSRRYESNTISRRADQIRE